MSNQPKKAAHPVLRGIGLLLLLIGVSVAALYVTIKTDAVTIDDPAALAAQTPIPASQRFIFDAANETVRISLDKSDLWWLLLPEMEENFLEDVNRELDNYQLSVTGYGMNITKKGVRIDLEAMYKSLRLPLHILTSLDFDGSGFSVTLTKAKLGPIRLPVGKLLSAADLRIDVDWPVVTDITDVAYRQDAVLLTGTLTRDMLSFVQDTCRNDAIGWFSTSHQAVFRAATAESGYKELLPGLEQDPASVEALYHDLFTLAQDFEYEAFMQDSRDLPHRFFPGIDYTALEAERESVREEWTFYNDLVDKLVTQASADFNNRRFSLKNGEFYLRNSVFDVLNYFTGDAAQNMERLFSIIDQDQFHLILVGSINGYAVKSPVLSRVCDKEQQLTQELNRNEAYPIGCVFRGLNGEYFLRYESMQILDGGGKTAKLLKTVTLSDAEYASLIQEGKIGVWIS